MEELMKQAPININEEIIKQIYERNNKDIIKSLMEMWELKEEKKNINGISKDDLDKYEKNQDEWKKIRETCDCFDNEMSKILKK